MKIFPATARTIGTLPTANLVELKSKMTALSKADLERLAAADKNKPTTKRTTSQKSRAEVVPSKKPRAATTSRSAEAVEEPRKLRPRNDEGVTAAKDAVDRGPLLSKKPQKTPPAAKVTGVAAEHRKPGRSKKSGAAATAATGPAAPAAVAAAPRVLTKEEMDSLKQKVNFISENQISAEVRRALKHPSEAKKKEGSCQCIDDCVDCACQKKCRYTAKGVLNRRLLNWAIVECGGYCGCKGRCRNRVTQDGPMLGLELIMTPDRGIGLRTSKDIKNGAFVMEYLGEVLLNANKKLSKNYAFSLVSVDGKQKFSLDAERHANSARLIHHSCNPNVWARPVYTCDTDECLPRIAFFALKDIPAGTELTVDYHPDLKLEDLVAIYGEDLVDCKCGARSCRGKL